jgi:hypothetical protein
MLPAVTVLYIVQPRCTIDILLQFIILHFNNFILPGPENLYVILARHNELPEDGILNVETCRSMLFVIIVFDIAVRSVVKIVNKKSELVSNYSSISN